MSVGMLEEARVFPTRVGMNRLTPPGLQTSPSIPHTRGDEPYVDWIKGGADLYSPHAWG